MSPLPFEQDEFKVYLTLVHELDGEYVEDTEEIINDSFDYLNTRITAEIDTEGYINYNIYDNDSLVKSDHFF